MAHNVISDEDQLTIRANALLGKCSREIGAIIGRDAKVIQSWCKRNSVSLPKRGGASGRWNGSWNGGRTVDKNGYILVRVKNHPFAIRHNRKNANCEEWGYMREHRLVMEEQLQRYLLPNEIVHHM